MPRGQKDKMPSKNAKSRTTNGNTLTLKQELIYRRHFKTRAEARQAIFDFIEVFYNRQRLHSSLDYCSPIDFETQNN